MVERSTPMSFWRGKSVLVAGGAGMIGSHVARTLLELGAEVCVADNLSSGIPRTIEDIRAKVRLEVADLRDADTCLRLTEDKDYVFQFAANMGGIGWITTIGADIMRDSALININMLEASTRNQVKRFFFSSSACIYPTGLQTTAEVVPLKEADALPADPNEFYGWEKLASEQLCEAYHQDYGLEVRIGRFHNIFGEAYTAFDLLKGKAPAHLVMKALRYPEEPFVVWGDGEQTRSFLYIDDCVEGVLRLVESDYSEPINIGSDRLVSINGMVNILREISGKPIQVEYDLSKPQGVRGRNADLTLVKEVLGWEPKVSLEEGLSRLYQWAGENLADIQQLLASEPSYTHTTGR
jgi:GDP-D-mannose 3', 5'-epimerase